MQGKEQALGNKNPDGFGEHLRSSCPLAWGWLLPAGPSCLRLLPPLPSYSQPLLMGILKLRTDPCIRNLTFWLFKRFPRPAWLIWDISITENSHRALRGVGSTALVLHTGDRGCARAGVRGKGALELEGLGPWGHLWSLGHLPTAPLLPWGSGDMALALSLSPKRSHRHMPS